jgi:hypothetical protein
MDDSGVTCRTATTATTATTVNSADYANNEVVRITSIRGPWMF